MVILFSILLIIFRNLTSIMVINRFVYFPDTFAIFFLGNIIFPIACDTCNNGTEYKNKNNQKANKPGINRFTLLGYFKIQGICYRTNIDTQGTGRTFIWKYSITCMYIYGMRTHFSTFLTINTAFFISGYFYRAEHTDETVNTDELKNRLKKALREELVVTPEVELVKLGTLERTEFKAKRIENLRGTA